MRRKPKEIIRSFKGTRSPALTAAALGIHRTTVYRWLKRARGIWSTHLRENIHRRSTKPLRTHYALTPEQRLAVERERLVHEAAAVKIKHVLGLSVSHMTIHRFLRRKGFVRQTKRYRRPTFQDSIHMHARNAQTVGYLQMDVKYITPELSGLPWTCFEYGLIDIFSRYKEAVILNQLDQDGARVALLEMLPKLPFKPIFIQTDNGLEFQARFHDHCLQMGLRHHFIHKNSPNENAVIERSFRTDEEEFFFRMPRQPQHYDELRDWFAAYLTYYNTERPHLGINLKTPKERVAEVVLH
jgi:transposase InsO family protein